MVSLNILSSDINSLKSSIARGDVFKVTIELMPASLDDFIPSGALYYQRLITKIFKVEFPCI